jgi:hypothetical protein
LDGKLLPTGSIAVIPVDGTPGPGGGGEIKEGKYAIKQGLRPGKYRVEIRGTRKLERLVVSLAVPSHLVKEEVEVIPAEYNTKSKEIREVKPGSQVLDFNLKGATASK